MFKNCCGCQSKKTNHKESDEDEDEEETKEKENDNQINNAIEQTNEATAEVIAQKEKIINEKIEDVKKEETAPPPEALPEFVQRKTSLKKPKPRLSISTEVKIIPSNFPEDLEDLGGEEEEEETTKKEEDEEDDDDEEVAVDEIKITIKNIDGKVIKKSLTDENSGKLSPPATEVDRPTSPLSDEVFVSTEQGGLELPLHNLGVKVDVIEKQALACGLDIPLSPRGQMPTPHPIKRGSMPAVLPRWLSEEEDEHGGTHEPPATPVARDELALRRHRFFSELLTAAQAATEHRVRFDPFGPTIERRQSTLSMSVQGYQDILQGPFASYLEISSRIGGDVAEHAKLVQQAFQAQLQYISLASQSSKPTQSDELKLLQPTSQHIQAIQDYREKHRTSQYFNHLSAISESIPALGWVTISPTPAPYVKEMNDAGQFYTNRVLKDWKEKDKIHVDWTKSWVQTLTELQSFVKQYHTTGIVWSGTTAPRVAGGGVPPPPPPCGMPPPPPVLDLGDIAPVDSGQDRSALFAEINQGENITRSLKKVTADMQTHKNPAIRSGPAPFKAPPASITNQTPKPFKATSPPTDKPPKFTRDGKKWLIEYQKGNHQLVVENAEMNNVIYVFKCTDSTLVVKGKVNSIFLDSCKKTAVVFDSVVSSIEFVNCQSVQMQVLGKVPTISIDKTDGCQMYLSQDSLQVEVISSKSSEMNVLVPAGNGDFTEYPVPEQYKTTVSSKGLTTIAVENKG